MNEKSVLKQQIAQYGHAQQEKKNTEFWLDEIFTILGGSEISPWSTMIGWYGKH